MKRDDTIQFSGSACDITAGDAPATPSRGRKAPRRNLFGRADLAAVYHRARDLIVKHNVFRMAQKAQADDGSISLVISNLWRLDRGADGAIRCYEFSIQLDRWIEVSSFNGWPDIPMFPIRGTQSLAWWRDVARAAIFKVLDAAGFAALPKHLTTPPPLPAALKARERRRLYDLRPPIVDPDMSPNKMASILVRHYLGDVAWGGQADRGRKPKGGMLGDDLGHQGARALRAMLYDHFLDPELVSALMAVDYRTTVSLTSYLQVAQQAEAFLRVARERRNLLPLLTMIAPAYRERRDLFSRALWVRDGRTRTLVDYRRFSLTKFAEFESFPTRASFRWICRAQISVVKRWASGEDGRQTQPIENIVAANINVRLPAIAWYPLVKPGERFLRLGVGEVAQRLVRAFAMHCEALWRERGFAALKEWLRERDARPGDVADWLLAEGIAAGHPERNATWASLARRSREWHERVAIANVRSNAGSNVTWQSLVPTTTIAGITFTPLNSAADLAAEGHSQHHCIGGYVHSCAVGAYRAYSVVEPAGRRAPLGLSVGRRGRWSIEQHRGACNGAIGANAAQAGRELLRLYQQAHDEHARSITSAGHDKDMPNGL
jgi:hypothetical protein